MTRSKQSPPPTAVLSSRSFGAKADGVFGYAISVYAMSRRGQLESKGANFQRLGKMALAV